MAVKKAGSKIRMSYSKITKQVDTDDSASYYVTFSIPNVTISYKLKKKRYKKSLEDCIDSWTVVWQWKDRKGIWHLGESSTLDKSAGYLTQTEAYDPPENAVRIRCKLKPVSKTYGNNNDKKYFVGAYRKKAQGWVTLGTKKATYTYNDAEAASTPSYTIDGLNLAVYYITDDTNTKSMKFHLTEGVTKKDVTCTTVKASKGSASGSSGSVFYYNFTMEYGKIYRLQAEAFDADGVSSGKSEYTDTFASSLLAIDDFDTILPASSTSVLFKWPMRYYQGLSYVTGVGELFATTYKLEYLVEDSSLYDVTEIGDGAYKINAYTFDQRSDNITSVEYSQPDTTLYYTPGDNDDESSTYSDKVVEYLQGLDTGKRYFFRLRPQTDDAEDAEWSAIHEIVLGTKPSMPSAWNLTTNIIDGETPQANWIHNSTDESSERQSTIEYIINDGESKTVVVDNPKDDYGEWKTETRSYEFTPESGNKFNDGTVIKWRVRTRGVLPGEYKMVKPGFHFGSDTTITDDDILTLSGWSDWSDWQTIYYNEKPEYTVNVGTSFPLSVDAKLNIDTQTLSGMTVELIATTDHQVIDVDGSMHKVVTGDVVFSKTAQNLTSTSNTITINAYEMAYGSHVTYDVNVKMTTSAGIDLSSTESFTSPTINYSESTNSNVRLYADTLTAKVYGLSNSSNSKVYRIEESKRYTELDIINNSYGYDPYAPFKRARYRVVNRNSSGSSITILDSPELYMKDCDWTAATWSSPQLKKHQDVILGAFINYGEKWISLLYNLDISPSYSRNVTTVTYDGRTDPVAYYSNNVTQTDSWSFELDARDRETRNKLMEMSLYSDDVYVREPSGIGYWASVTVSITETHAEYLSSVTLDITRVDHSE